MLISGILSILVVINLTMTNPIDIIAEQMAVIRSGLTPTCGKCEGRGFYYVLDKTGEDGEQVVCEHITNTDSDDEADKKHEARAKWLKQHGTTEEHTHVDVEGEFIVGDSLDPKTDQLEHVYLPEELQYDLPY